MSKTREQFKVVRPSRQAERWMESELSRFKEDEHRSLANIIELAERAPRAEDTFTPHGPTT